ncbi:Nitrate transporter [Venturia nashicola]|nr:Nitrate transporter [Venturia nashicola]
MDAAKHLKGLGWRGEGHSLDSTNRGLRKPLLVSNRHANQGLGSKSQKEKQADQWWLNAFDNALKEIGTGKESNLAQVAKHGVKLGGLYGFFVKGEQLVGTIEEENTKKIEEVTQNTKDGVISSTEPSSVETSDASDSSDSESLSPSEGASLLTNPQPSTMGNQRFGSRSKVLQSGSNAAPLGANRRVFGGGSSDPVVEAITAPLAQAAPASVPERAPAPVRKLDPMAKDTKEPKKSKDKKRKREEAAPEIVAKEPAAPTEGPEPKKAKVVDGIIIPAPQPIIREKKKKESARETRERRAKEKAEAQRQAFLENKQKALEEGTFDFEADAKRKKERELERMVKEELRRREATGEFGPKLPHPSVLLKYEKEVEKELRVMGKLGDLEMEKKLMHAKVGIPELDPKKKIKYKEEKYKREKLKRTAKREIKGRMRAAMFGEVYIPESELTPEELKERKRAEKEELRAKRRITRAGKAEKAEEKEAAKALRRAAKIERREQKKEQRKKTEEAIAARKAALLEDKGVDVFQAGSDEIKLGININGRQRTIPGVGAVTKYPSKAEKALKKRECRAYELGISLEEYDAREAREKAEKDAPELQRIAEVQKARGGLNSKQWFRYCWLAQTESQEDAEKFFLSTIEKKAAKAAAEKASGAEKKGAATSSAPPSFPKPDAMKGPEEFADATDAPRKTAKPLSAKKLKKYASKAEKKGITIEEYISKKEEARKDATSASAATAMSAILPPAPANGVSLPKAIKAPPGSLAHKLLSEAVAPAKPTTTTNIPTSGFVIDTAGDPHLNTSSGPTANLGFIVDTTGDPDILTRPKPVLVWHPDMLGARKVKDLSKEERAARLVWMRARRAARHEAKGETPVSKKERHKKRVEKKQKQRNYLVAQIMSESKKARSEVGKEELEEARRKAKRAMREIKREKRNKVIHRKKLGGGLRGQFGGAISMGGRDRALDD